MTRDLLAADSLLPYRVGLLNPDPPGSFFSDRITIGFPDSAEAPASTRTYHLKVDQGAGTSQLMRYDGDRSDLPVVDHVVGLAFEYFGERTARRVRVTLRVEAAAASLRGPAGPLFANGGVSAAPERYVPDREIRFDVSPRHLRP